MARNMTANARHEWDHDSEKRIAACATHDGNARNARGCIKCRMTKVTVIPPYGLPWHEWVTQDGKTWIGEATPPCLPRKSAEVVKFCEPAA